MDNLKYASFARRLSAFIIDSCIMFAFFYVIVMILGGAYYSGVLAGYLIKNHGLTLEEGKYLGVFALNAAMMIVLWFYFIFMTYKFGATFGKMIMKIKVSSDKDRKLGLWQLILREIVGKYLYLWVGIILAIMFYSTSFDGEKINFVMELCIFIIGYGMMFFTKQKQTLHDKIASTVVLLEK